jgi:hypothetical protein
MPASISRATPADRDEIAAHLAALNSRPEHLCPYVSDRLDQIERELDTYVDLGRSLVARRDGRIVAFLGAEVDLEAAKVWVYGPFIDVEPWAPLADRMWAELQDAFAGQPLLFEIYYGRSHTEGEAFAARHGFSLYKQARIMRFPGDHLARLTGPDAPDLEPGQAEQVIVLHDRLFPNTYLPGRSMVTGLNQNKRCFVVSEDDGVLGYLYGEVTPEVHDAFIAFVGTIEEARGRGIGSRLVTTALRWMLSYEGLDEVGLSVDEDNTGARRLYERLGWDLLVLTQAFRLQT